MARDVERRRARVGEGYPGLARTGGIHCSLCVGGGGEDRRVLFPGIRQGRRRGPVPRTAERVTAFPGPEYRPEDARSLGRENHRRQEGPPRSRYLVGEREGDGAVQADGLLLGRRSLAVDAQLYACNPCDAVHAVLLRPARLVRIPAEVDRAGARRGRMGRTSRIHIPFRRSRKPSIVGLRWQRGRRRPRRPDTTVRWGRVCRKPGGIDGPCGPGGPARDGGGDGGIGCVRDGGRHRAGAGRPDHPAVETAKP